MTKKRIYLLFLFFISGSMANLSIAQDVPVLPLIQTDSVSPDTLTLQPQSKPIQKNKPTKDTAHYALYKKIFLEKDTNTVLSWKYYPNGYDIDPYPYDSTLDMLHLYNPAFKDGKVNSYLGQIGQAIQSQQFFNPNPPTRFIFLQSFTPYLYQANNAEYYNVKKPFTLFGFDTGPKDEQDVTLLHTQNVNQNLNFFFRFNSYTGLGYYVNQETKNNAGILGGSFIKGRFASRAAWTFGRVNALESGGVTDPSAILDNTLSPNEIGSRLSNGHTFIKDRQLFFDQKIGFIKAKENDTANTGGYWFSLQYTFDKQYSRKYYSDDTTTTINTTTKERIRMYQNNYSGLGTFDTCSYADQVHIIRLNLEEVKNPYAPFGLYGELGYEKAKYYYFNIDTLFDNTTRHQLESGFFEAGLHRMRPGLLRFNGSYRQYLAGYHLGDFDFRGQIIQRFSHDSLASSLTISGVFQQMLPDYFITHYQSNHYKWLQSFNSRPLKTQVEFQLSVPSVKTALGGHYALLTNYIYLNRDGNPDQSAKTFLVLDGWLNNRLNIWRLNLINRLNYQYTGNKKALPLPRFSIYESLFYQQDLYFESTQGRAKLQAGVDMFYWTKYQAPGYCPATAMFYNQDETTTGNYPFAGAFVNIEIKRLRFFLRVNHITYNLLDNNYFMAPYYPIPKTTIYYGIRWTFYN